MFNWRIEWQMKNEIGAWLGGFLANHDFCWNASTLWSREVFFSAPKLCLVVRMLLNNKKRDLTIKMLNLPHLFTDLTFLVPANQRPSRWCYFISFPVARTHAGSVMKPSTVVLFSKELLQFFTGHAMRWCKQTTQQRRKIGLSLQCLGSSLAKDRMCGKGGCYIDI